jgi:hypothetical protein
MRIVADATQGGAMLPSSPRTGLRVTAFSSKTIRRRTDQAAGKRERVPRTAPTHAMPSETENGSGSASTPPIVVSSTRALQLATRHQVDVTNQLICAGPVRTTEKFNHRTKREAHRIAA